MNKAAYPAFLVLFGGGNYSLKNCDPIKQVSYENQPKWLKRVFECITVLKATSRNQNRKINKEEKFII